MTDQNTTEMSESDGGDTTPDDDVEENVPGVESSPGPTTEQKADVDDLAQDTLVTWNTSGDQAYGKVVDTISEGAYASAIDGDQVVGAPAARIEVYDFDGEAGEWSSTETMVAHKPDTLSATHRDEWPVSTWVAMEAAGYQHREKVTRFSAADPKRRIVYGAVLVPDELDHHGDFLRESTIHTLSEDFATALADPDAEPAGEIPSGLDRAGVPGVMHAVFPGEHISITQFNVLDRAQDVGIGPMSRTYPAGTWLMGFKIHDDQLWGLVERGVFGGFSIGMWVTGHEEYDPGELPDDVRVPDAVETRLESADLSIDDEETGEVTAGSVHECSLVDQPAVPRAQHVAHKTTGTGPEAGIETGTDTDGDTDTDAATGFTATRAEQPSYALAKAAAALTESFDSGVSFFESRGHSPTDAEDAASYIQRAMGDDAVEEKGFLGRLFDRGAGERATKASPRSVGGLRTATVDSGTDGESGEHTERAGKTLNRQNRHRLYAAHDNILDALGDADADGGRMRFATDPEYDYDGLTALLDTGTGTDTERSIDPYDPTNRSTTSKSDILQMNENDLETRFDRLEASNDDLAEAVDDLPGNLADAMAERSAEAADKDTEEDDGPTVEDRLESIETKIDEQATSDEDEGEDDEPTVGDIADRVGQIADSVEENQQALSQTAEMVEQIGKADGLGSQQDRSTAGAEETADTTEADSKTEMKAKYLGLSD